MHSTTQPVIDELSELAENQQKWEGNYFFLRGVESKIMYTHEQGEDFTCVSRFSHPDNTYHYEAVGSVLGKAFWVGNERGEEQGDLQGIFDSLDSRYWESTTVTELHRKGRERWGEDYHPEWE